MALSTMIQTDEDALICDLAETYHIYDYRSLPLRLVATFSVGLRDDSRIMKKIRNEKVSPQILLIASAVDRLSLLVWAKTKNGQKGMNKPKMLVDQLIGNAQKEDIESFDSGDDFEKRKAQILGGA